MANSSVKKVIQLDTEHLHKISSQGFTFLVKEEMVQAIHLSKENRRLTRKSKDFEQILNSRLSLLAENESDKFLELIDVIDFTKDLEARSALNYLYTVERTYPLRFRNFPSFIWPKVELKLKESEA